MTHRVTKTYGHDLGLSACFRQWRATSHCRFLHGYALAFTVVFEAKELDANGWVIDFGGLKAFKAWLCENFDHRLLVAADDPYHSALLQLHGNGLADVNVLPAVGCETFAKMAANWLRAWLRNEGQAGRVRLVSVECREHAGNAAEYRP